jgi:glycosyltransferase involved in cell wall biosynthesis
MRITMVSARYLPFVGGVETHIHEVGKRMAALGHQVEVVTTNPLGSLVAEEMVDGMRIKRVPAWPKNRDFYFAPRIFSEIARSHADILHFQGYNTFVAPIGMAAAIRQGIPFALTFHSGGHSSPLRNAIRRFQHLLLSPLIGQASHLIGVSVYEAEFFAHRMGLQSDRFSVVPNGASLPPPSNPRPPVDPNLVVSIGRLERYKGHHRVIEAFPQLLKRIADARLKIVGSGPYEAELRRMVTTYGLDDRVTFESIPAQERRRLTDLLCTAGLVVLLSDYEAHPVSVMEALSVGRPVLVTDTSGLRELAQKGLCVSIPLEAIPTTIAVAIAMMLRVKSSEPLNVSLPNWDDCTSQLHQIYEEVVNRSSVTHNPQSQSS